VEQTGRTAYVTGKNSAIFPRGIRRLLRLLGTCRRCFRPASAAAQTGEPVKIGYSKSLTGGLAPNGRSALLAQKIWEEEINAKGGLLGRPEAHLL
jgi:branched-chain amino acid transport system substrate-binding protein